MKHTEKFDQLTGKFLVLRSSTLMSGMPPKKTLESIEPIPDVVHSPAPNFSGVLAYPLPKRLIAHGFHVFIILMDRCLKTRFSVF